MAKAIWNGAVVAESDNCEIVEGNYYFPPDTIKAEYFQPSNTHTICSWKGEASYYTLRVDGQDNKDAAWYYPCLLYTSPSPRDGLLSRMPSSA